MDEYFPGNFTHNMIAFNRGNKCKKNTREGLLKRSFGSQHRKNNVEISDYISYSSCILVMLNAILRYNTLR